MPRSRTNLELPAMTPEARENQMISLAVNLAERQLAEGTASASVIVHYLRLAGTREAYEVEKLKRENELLRAKTKAYESSSHADELYEEAVRAFRKYSGDDEDDYSDQVIF